MHTSEMPHIIFSFSKCLFLQMKTTALPTLPNFGANFAEFRFPLCRKKNQKNGQGRDTLPNSAKWVESPTPTCRFPYQITDIFEEVSIFVVWLGRFAPIAK